MSSHAPRLVLGLIAAVTLALSAGGALGIWPTGSPAGRWDTAADGPVRPAAARVMTRDMEGHNGDVRGNEASDPPASEAQPAPEQPQAQAQPQAQPDQSESDTTVSVLPARSGTGRRVVFDQSEQRVWLVDRAGEVRRTYPVSGSETDNLGPGRYDVYSRSRHAVSYTYEETMQYMVRFTHGEQAAIGFHDIPVDQRGRRVQTRAELGQRLSSGCIRQARPDARAMWRFADVGTSVVVVR